MVYSQEDGDQLTAYLGPLAYIHRQVRSNKTLKFLNLKFLKFWGFGVHKVRGSVAKWGVA